MPFTIDYTKDFEERKKRFLDRLNRDSRDHSKKKVLEKENMLIVQTKYDSFFAGTEVTDNHCLLYNPNNGTYVDIHVRNAIRRINPAVITVHITKNENLMETTEVMGNGLISHSRTYRGGTLYSHRDTYMDTSRLSEILESYLEKQSRLIEQNA